MFCPTAARPTLSDRAFATLLITFTMLYHAIVGAQGFDMFDEGWSLTGFQQIFNDPESVEYLFLYYLTNLVGGMWNSLFGWGGIYAFRLLTGLVLTLTALVVWRLLCPYLNRWLIFLGLFLSYLCSYYGIMVFYHNYLTALLSVCAAFALFRALSKNNPAWMLLSGLLIGWNTFVRLPNVTLVGMIVLLIPHYMFQRDVRTSLKLGATAIIGFAAGVLSVLLLMLLLGHLSIFLSAVEGGFSAASDSASTHNLSSMATTYLSVYLTVFTAGYTYNTYIIYFLGTLTSLWVVFSRRHQPAYVYLACLSLLILHLLPLGSDFGIENMGENCVYLATPFTIGMLGRWISHMGDHPKLRFALGTASMLLVLAFALRGGKHILKTCYFDEGLRTDKTYLPAASLATTFTTAQNSQELDTILQELSHYVKPGDELLCFQNMPMLHFLTQTRPYLGNPWVWSYDPSNMKRHFDLAEAKGHKQPIMVREKTMIPHWLQPYPDWNNAHAKESYLHKNQKIVLIQQFIKKNDYHVVWEDSVCQILVSQHRKEVVPANSKLR